MPEATPAQLIECAAASDFDFGGMWVEKDTWTPATTRAIRQQARDAGVGDGPGAHRAGFGAGVDRAFA